MGRKTCSDIDPRRVQPADLNARHVNDIGTIENGY